MRHIGRPMGLLVVSAAVVLATAGAASSASFETKLLRGAAIGLAVKAAAKPLNQFINTVTLRHNMGSRLSTKVVPILSIGEKGYVGGAQVSGPASQVSRVSAVFQYEKNFDDNNYRAKVLVASASLNPLELKRVPKVGVTAIIDVALDGGLGVHTVGTGIQVGDVVRGAAVLVAVKAAGPAINKVINTITLNKGLATAVVPMGSIGEKAYLGGAQVSAAASAIGRVKAVWQYEGLFADGRFRVKVMVPASALNPLQMKRVDGAGVTAVIDMALSQQETDWRRDARRPTGIWGSRYGRNGNVYDYRSRRRGGHDDDDDDDERVWRRHDNGRHLGWYKQKKRPKHRD